MVTQTSDVPAGAVLHDRGFVSEQPASLAEYRSNRFMFYPAPFWGPVIAGTLFVFSTFVLSWYLMLGCDVGVGADHMFALGWGAAIWMWVTAAVAFWCGGMIAGMIASPRNFGWLKGAAIWGLSIPLALVTYSFAGGLGLFGSLGHLTAMNETAGMVTNFSYTGFAWATFITLGIGLIFALIGSGAAGPYRPGIDTVTDTTAPVPVAH